DRHAPRQVDGQFRTLFEQAPISVQILAPDGRTLKVNRAWETLWGVTLADIPGYNLLEDEQLVANGVMPYIERAFAGEAAAIPPGAYRPSRGVYANRERWVRASIFPVRDRRRAIREVVLMHEDMTERVQAEEAVEFQAHLLDAVEQAVIATDLSGTITYWNRFAERLYGWSAAEVIGRNVVDVTPAEASHEQAAEILGRVRAGESWSGEFGVRRRDGTAFPAEVTASPIRDDAGELIGVVGVSVDVSERRAAEAERERLYAEAQEAIR